MRGGGMQVLLGLAVVAILGLAAYMVFFQEQPVTTTISGQSQTETGAVPVGATVSCPSDLTTNGQIRYEDGLQATNTYGDPTCYFVPMTAGQERITAGTLQTDGTYSTSVDLPCTASGTKWQVVCVTTHDSWTSVVDSSTFTAAGDTVRRDVVGADIGLLKAKVEDRVTGGAKFFNITCDATTTQGYESLSALCNITNDASTTGTSLTLGADEYIDAVIYLKTVSTKQQYGEDDLRTWMLVDADGSSWSEPVVFRDGGSTLTNQMSSMETEDLRKYSGFEYAYEIGKIGDRESTINFYLQSASGVNPGASVDPVVEFCAEGRYNSQKQKDTILVGCWTDAATQTGVFTTTQHKLTFDVS